MDHLQRGILTLVRSAITGESLALPEQFDMEAAYPQIQRHQIMPLAYVGAVSCGVDKSLPVMQKLFQHYLQYMMRSEGQMKAVRQLCTAFDGAGVDYMLLKGCNLKALYPKPELRLMGDADILIRTEQYDRIRPIMEQLGYTEKVESDHELVWYKKELLVELHKRLIPSYNKDYYRYFGDGWRLAKPAEGTRYGMNREDALIYIFTHFAKHYRDGGIGCRHVTDLWIYRRTYPQLDEDYILAELDKLQLRSFYEHICDLITVWFEHGTENDRAAFMTDFIFGSGSWGKKESHVLSAGVKEAAIAGSVQKGKRNHIRRLLFPSADALKKQYPILAKAPYLLPFCWILRGIRVVFFERGKIDRQKQRLAESTPDKIETYQQALHYVGLDFNFEE